MTLKLNFSNTFFDLGENFYSLTRVRALENPELVIADSYWKSVFGGNDIDEKTMAEVFGGHKLLNGSRPLSMVYSGHQFGSYNPQLGDGRGILLGEFTHRNILWDLHLKGAGLTPYSRLGDGYAVLRSCIREYLASVAMQGLGIPTTHALCVVRGDDKVQRETIEPAAMLTRIARSHIRFGSFEWFHYNEEFSLLKQLADYVVQRYFPELVGTEDCYNVLFNEVVKRTAKLIAGWQAVGFAHGVLNTDNMSIIGETFDYGPYGFMEAYDPSFVCNHSDNWGRYAFDQQPSIGLWNLNALAFALSSLLNQDAAKTSLENFEPTLIDQFYFHLYKKLGWTQKQEGDRKLIAQLFDGLQKSQVDYCHFFRNLSYRETPELIHNYLDKHVEATGGKADQLMLWLREYEARSLSEITANEQQSTMLNHNPKYILRNYLAQQAIDEAYECRSYSLLEKLDRILRTPFEEHPEHDELTKSAPAWAKKLVVSCSS